MHTTVVTASRSAGIRSGLTYESEDRTLKPGSLVRVPLRRSIVEGIVTEIMEERRELDFDLKRVHEILGTEPLLTEAQMKTARWMAEYTMTDLRHVLGVFLPSPPWKSLLPEEVVGYRLGDGVSGVGRGNDVKGVKQIAVITYLTGKNWISEEELRDETGARMTTLKRLVTDGIITREKKSGDGDGDGGNAILSHASFIRKAPPLSALQREIYEALRSETKPSLLFGITGSGKTHIYAELIERVIRSGGQAIYLVPEILLTEHVTAQFESFLDPRIIAVLHSRLTPAERRHQWRRIRRGDVSLVVGSRSALFAPLQHLKLVIVDEEHEWTYKNEQTPRYHARETAEELCRSAGAKFILGTATPSLESWSRAKAGSYHLARLPERYQNQSLPKVRIIDLADVRFGTLYPFSPPLLEAIADRLKRGEQSVLFLNRRGVASALLCLDCRRRIISPESKLPYTLHHSHDGRPMLIDHTTGLTVDVPATCPHCRSARLLAIGAGTQKIESLLQRQFPSARVLRADSDTMEGPLAMRGILTAMRQRTADILLGTQSVAKGLDLPGVTLAAVLVADIGLSLPHFRAGERIFQLLMQLIGRSGRHNDGEVIIQTFRPDAEEVTAAARHATEEYLEKELHLRIAAGYPPATRMIRLLLRGERAERNATSIATALRTKAGRTGSDVRVSSAPTFFGGGTIWHVLLRGSDPRTLLSGMDLGEAVIDVDPMETI